jgi:diguanylate cyclase (GGDEF)-like protein/PAS domain S-box-containing protein
MSETAPDSWGDEQWMKQARRLQLALDGAGQGVWDHDFQAGKTYFSATWKHIRGYGPDDDVDALAGPWLDRLHPEDRPRILEAITQQNTGKLTVNAFEYRERHRDGRWIWILSRGRPVEWRADGSVARILGTDTDISALKEVELALAQEKERLLVTFRSIAEGLACVDASGIITDFNAAAAEITGWAPEDAIGQSAGQVLDLRSGADQPIAGGLVIRALSLRTSLTLADDTVIRRRDGARRRAHCSFSPIVADSRNAGLVIVFRDTTEEHEFKARLHHAATHDALTGLPNRQAFDEAFQSAIRAARGEKRLHMLALLDLDGFKAVNDGAGHAAGDEVLKGIAACLRHCVRAGDIVARLGGDEFGLILTDIDIPAAHAICDRLTESIASLPFFFDGREYRVGASIGIKTISGDALSATKLMSSADKACYLAKAEGRGRWVSADRKAA